MSTEAALKSLLKEADFYCLQSLVKKINAELDEISGYDNNELRLLVSIIHKVIIFGLMIDMI